MCHISGSRDHRFPLSQLLMATVYLLCTGRHVSDRLDCNEHTRRCSPPISSCCFLSIDHVSQRCQASVSSHLTTTLGVNRCLQHKQYLATTFQLSVSMPMSIGLMLSCKRPCKEDGISPPVLRPGKDFLKD